MQEVELEELPGFQSYHRHSFTQAWGSSVGAERGVLSEPTGFPAGSCENQEFFVEVSRTRDSAPKCGDLVLCKTAIEC